MKALSVRQPWASLIASGAKTIEIRSRRTHYRGPVLICSSARPLGSGPVGVAVCVVEVLDCHPLVPEDAIAACHPWSGGGWAWVLRLVRLVEPFPVRGRLGFYEVTIPNATA